MTLFNTVPTLYRCGCKVEEKITIGALKGLGIKYCPMHKAAPEMLAELEAALQNLQNIKLVVNIVIEDIKTVIKATQQPPAGV